MDHWKKTLGLVIGLVLLTCSATSLAADGRSPLDVVNARMDAHNRHDLSAFLATYSEEIQIYDYPNTALGKKGRAHLKGIFGPLFVDKAVRVEVHTQIANGKYVVNHETVVRRGKSKVYVSIYEVEDGLIKSVRFIKE